MASKADPLEMRSGVTRRNVTQRYGVVLLVVYVASALFFLALGVLEWKRIGRNIDAIALERGRVIFNLVELTREWNALHGGVYVPVTENTQPNPYLDHPRRDQQTVEGREFTMVNPAFMTRQIAELAEKRTGVRLHITSLNPIRPANAPDAWEAESLALFEKEGLKERVEFFDQYLLDDVRRPVHRYMAPLMVKSACLTCHQKQGYQLGDIRGGIALVMPAEELQAVAQRGVKGSLAIILVAFMLTTMLLHLLAARARRHYRDLHEVAQLQESIIAERTNELEVSNRELKSEIGERRKRERELRLAGAVFENAAEAIVVTDARNNIVRVNPAFTSITGYTPKEVMGCNPRILKSGRHDAAFYESMWNTLQERGHWEGEIWNRHKSGDIYVEWLSIVKIDEGVPEEGYYLAVFHDITRRKETEDLLRYKAHHDALTDLPNRSLFYDRLQSTLALARRYHRKFALLMVDLDHFKEVNDTLGHPAGDQLLIEVSRRLISCLRESDTVARLGGDEFAMILEEVSSISEVEQVAQRAVQIVGEPYFLDAGTAHVSASIGIAMFPEHGDDDESLQHCADIALYAVKEEGRNGYRVYSGRDKDNVIQPDLL